MRRFVNCLVSAGVLLGALAGPVPVALAAKGFVQAPGSPFSPGVGHLFSARLADLNGDGDLDAVVPDGYGLGISVLLGDGHGRLTPTSGSPLQDPAGAGPVAIADFNGDGKLDFAVSNQFASSVSVWLGDGREDSRAHRRRGFRSTEGPATLRLPISTETAISTSPRSRSMVRRSCLGTARAASAWRPDRPSRPPPIAAAAANRSC